MQIGDRQRKSQIAECVTTNRAGPARESGRNFEKLSCPAVSRWSAGDWNPRPKDPGLAALGHFPLRSVFSCYTTDVVSLSQPQGQFNDNDPCALLSVINMSAGLTVRKAAAAGCADRDRIRQWD
jgi:hypothetical protein